MIALVFVCKYFLFQGFCEYDDQNMAIDKKLSSLSSVPASTLDDCKTECQNYQNGEEQCWAVKYQNSANKCYMYASVSPQDFFSSTSNTNKNIFYSTRDCFSCKYVFFLHYSYSLLNNIH